MAPPSSQFLSDSVDRDGVTPFPALHTSANADADEHLATARKLADDAQSWLADLDAVLSEAPLRSERASSVRTR